MNLKLRVVFSIIAIVSLALALTPGVAFAASIPGSFSCGASAPTVSDPEPGNPVITPDVPNTINFSVTDSNTLGDIESITVHIYYDADGIYNAGDLPADGTQNPQTYATLTWTPATGWIIDAGSSTTWAIDTANCVTPSLGSSSGDFVLSYIPGIVATESASNASDWVIYIEVDDGSTTPDTSFTDDLEMAWYGAITINTAGVYWGEVVPGMLFGDTGSEVADISITYICNGAYDEQIAASAIWDASVSETDATLDIDGIPSAANSFSLEADDDGTLDGAVIVNTAPDNYTAIDTTGTITEEAGDTVITNSIWLALNAVFASDTYTGAIFYQIAQGS